MLRFFVTGTFRPPLVYGRSSPLVRTSTLRNSVRWTRSSNIEQHSFLSSVAGSVIQRDSSPELRRSATSSVHPPSYIVSPPTAFTDLGLPASVATALARNEISHPTPIQTTAIPQVLAGDHTLIAAETGSGKTFAYLAPLVARLKATDPPMELRRPGRPRAIVLVPTRELVTQVVSVAKTLTRECRFSVREAVGGGGSTAARRKSLRKRLETEPVDVLIATPGMLAVMRQRKQVLLSELETVVIDEADVTLAAQGFEEQVAPFLAAVDMKPKLDPPQKAVQFVYAGASLPASLRWRIRKRHALPSAGGSIEGRGKGRVAANSTISSGMVNCDLKVAETEGLHIATPPKLLTTKFIRVQGGESGKLKRAADAVMELTSRDSEGKIMVFCDRDNRRKQLADMISEILPQGVSAVHMSARASTDRFDRWKDWTMFKEDPSVRVAICAQSFSRGIDLPAIRHVVMTDVPMTGTEYLHRVGRIRAPSGNSNVSVTVLVSTRDRAIAEALFLAHVREDNLSALNAPAAWRAYVDACRDRIGADPLVLKARKKKQALWIDERDSPGPTARGSPSDERGSQNMKQTHFRSAEVGRLAKRRSKAIGSGLYRGSGPSVRHVNSRDQISVGRNGADRDKRRRTDISSFGKSRDSRRARRYESKRYSDAGPYGGTRR